MDNSLDIEFFHWFQNLFDNAKEQWRSGPGHQFWHQYSEKLKDAIVRLIVVCHEKIVGNPYVEKCQEYVRHSVFNLYKRCLPYLARLSESSVLAASIGFCIGVLLTGKANNYDRLLANWSMYESIYT